MIDEKYGFNKKTLILYFTDLMFETMLQFFLIPGVLYGYIFIVENGGNYFVFYVILLSFK